MSFFYGSIYSNDKFTAALLNILGITYLIAKLKSTSQLFLLYTGS